MTRGAGNDGMEFAETLPVITWTATPDGRVDYITSDFYELTGLGDLDLASDAWLLALHPDDREPTIAVWRQAIEQEKPYRVEFRIKNRHTKDHHWHLVQARPHRDDSGRIVKWIGVALDIHERHLAEAALASAEQQTKRILEASGEGVLGIDQDGAVVFENPRALEILGYTHDELIGRPAHSTIHHSHADGSAFPAGECPIYQTRVDGQSRRVADDVFFHKDGTPVPVAYTVAAISDPQTGRVAGVVVNFRTIGHERRERLLRELEAHVLRLIGNDQPLYQVLDEVTRCIERIQPEALASILLVEAGRLRHGSAPSLSEDYIRAIDGLEIGPTAGSCGTVAHTGRPQITANVANDPLWADFRELAARHGLQACWSTPVLDAEGRVLATFAIYYRQPREPGSSDLELIQRITQFVALAIERIRQRQALRDNEERFRVVAMATSDVVWDWDLRSDSVWWSEGIETQFRYKRPEIDDSSTLWSAMIHPDDRERIVASIHAAIERGDERWFEEYRLLTADARELVVEDRGRLIKDHGGQPTRMVGSIVDVTDMRRLEQQLRQSQRLETIGQLTGGIAHDFNNLLTVMLGNAELLAEGLEKTSVMRDLAEMIRSAAGRGAELTNRLLAFARKQALEPQATDVDQLIAGMDGLLRRTLGENIEIEFVRGGGLWPAIVDPAQLENALLNLGINARDAMPRGGKLTIETGNAHLDDEYAASTHEVTPGQYVLIAVSDTGAGMDDETLAQAFEPFFSTKKAGKGSGLGLSMVYGFTRQSGGHVRIYSEKDEGTTIKLYLPRADGARPANPRPRPPRDRVESGTETILLVEDNDLVRGHVENLLASLGYRVHSAGDGQQALAILESDAMIDLLFTDVVMPGGLSGKQLAGKAQELRPGLPVLYTSGYTENAIVHHGRLDSGVQLLQKPYRRQDLAAKIRKVLDEA